MRQLDYWVEKNLIYDEEMAQIPMKNKTISSVSRHKMKKIDQIAIEAYHIYLIQMNEYDAPALSLDIPSGMDPDSGLPHIPCVQATTTLMLALSKTGFIHDASREHIGDLFLADIGIPPILLQDLGISADLLNTFQYEAVLPIRLERKSFVRNPEGDY